IYRGQAHGYPLFTVAYHRDGKPARKAFGVFARARAFAQQVATLTARGRVDVLSLSSADRDGYVAALNLLQPLGIPLHSAVEEYVTARSHLHVVCREGTRSATAACHSQKSWASR